MGIVTTGAVAALFMGVCMGATLKPSTSIAARAQQAPRLVIDRADTGLLATAERLQHSAS